MLTLQPSLSEAHRWKTAQAATGANVTVLRREAGEATLLVLGELDAADAIVLKTDDSETDDVAAARHDQPSVREVSDELGHGVELKTWRAV